jgi:curli biogenesis system outer membrane secretion channel CsgG
MQKTIGLIASAIIIITVFTSCATTSEYVAYPGNIADAVLDGYTNVKEMIPAKRRVVVIGITGRDISEAIWARDELTHLLVSARRHVVIDRRGLGLEVAERKPTGEIEEASAKDIGYLLGAEVVVFGNINHYENQQISFFSLKAMDVRSGNIIAVTSERFKAS